jgi:hypothetical protein
MSVAVSIQSRLKCALSRGRRKFVFGNAKPASLSSNAICTFYGLRHLHETGKLQSTPFKAFVDQF